MCGCGRWYVLKMLCERWCVCVCDKDGVCERWCVTKLCVTKMCVKDVCDKVVLTKWCVTMLCVTRDQSQHSAKSATPAKQNMVDVTKCHACHAKRKSMSPSATPATQKCRGVPCFQGAPSAPPDPAQSQPGPISATPATRNQGPCHQVPRLPLKR